MLLTDVVIWYGNNSFDIPENPITIVTVLL